MSDMITSGQGHIVNLNFCILIIQKYSIIDIPYYYLLSTSQPLKVIFWNTWIKYDYLNKQPLSNNVDSKCLITFTRLDGWLFKRACLRVPPLTKHIDVRIKFSLVISRNWYVSVIQMTEMYRPYILGRLRNSQTFEKIQ